MTLSIFLAIMGLITYTIALVSICSIFLLRYMFHEISVLQNEMLSLLTADEDDFDTRYEQNRQIINPIEDNPFS